MSEQYTSEQQKQTVNARFAYCKVCEFDEHIKALEHAVEMYFWYFERDAKDNKYAKGVVNTMCIKCIELTETLHNVRRYLVEQVVWYFKSDDNNDELNNILKITQKSYGASGRTLEMAEDFVGNNSWDDDSVDYKNPLFESIEQSLLDVRKCAQDLRDTYNGNEAYLNYIMRLADHLNVFLQGEEKSFSKDAEEKDVKEVTKCSTLHDLLNFFAAI